MDRGHSGEEGLPGSTHSWLASILCHCHQGTDAETEAQNEVGDRWASGLDTWYLSSEVKFKHCSHPDIPRTKLVVKAELC